MALGKTTPNEMHGLRGSPEWAVWHNMRDRCYRESHRQYPDYGGRGITVCDEWRESFSAFLRDMGPRPSPDHSIDRIDNDGPYSPENCRWATRSEQQRNKRCLTLTLDGRTQSAATWAIEIGLDRRTILERKRRGWSDEDALDPRRWNGTRSVGRVLRRSER